MTRRSTRRVLVGATASALVVTALSTSALSASADESRRTQPAGTSADHAVDRGRVVDVQLLAFNDFHGNLEPPEGSSGEIVVSDHVDPETGEPDVVPAGGVEYLATHLSDARRGHLRSLTVTAGDTVGASPLLSGAFHDEPTIEAMNRLGLDVTTVGNHEFDEGSAELTRLAYGGCRHDADGSIADDSCADGDFVGATYPILSANVIDKKTGKTLLPPYAIKHVGGVKIGFIGVTLEGTPNIVTAAGVQGLAFKDEAKTINKYSAILQKHGVKAIVALIHEGGEPVSQVYDYACNAGGLGLTGPIVDIAKKITPQVDLLVTGHTHQAYVCDIPDPAGNPRMVTSAASYGRLFTDIELSYDRGSRDIVRTSVGAENFIVTRDVMPSPTMTELIEKYQKYVAPIANRTIGYIDGTILGRGCETGGCPDSGEEPAGDLIADAQLWALQNDPLNDAGADFAVMNPGGIRADFTCADGPCEVTYGDAFAVQPFTNFMKVIDLSGEDVVEMFQQQWSTQEPGDARILQVSDNVRFTYDESLPQSEGKLLEDTLTIDGQPVDPDRTYHVVMNEYLGGAGDNFYAIGNGADVYTGQTDLDALDAYMGEMSSADEPYPVPAADRITRLN